MIQQNLGLRDWVSLTALSSLPLGVSPLLIELIDAWVESIRSLVAGSGIGGGWALVLSLHLQTLGKKKEMHERLVYDYCRGSVDNSLLG